MDSNENNSVSGFTSNSKSKYMIKVLLGTIILFFIVSQYLYTNDERITFLLSLIVNILFFKEIDKK